MSWRRRRPRQRQPDWISGPHANLFVELEDEAPIGPFSVPAELGADWNVRVYAGWTNNLRRQVAVKAFVVISPLGARRYDASEWEEFFADADVRTAVAVSSGQRVEFTATMFLQQLERHDPAVLEEYAALLNTD